jgi:hypothetical protein
MIIFLSGPTGSGKDEVAKFIMKHADGFIDEYKMSQPLKDAFKYTFKFNPQAITQMLEPFKDRAFSYSLTDNDTPRQFQIDYFYFLVERYGEDILAKIGVKIVSNMSAKHIVIDCGRNIEIETFTKIPIKAHGIKITRPGHAFNDSREPIDFKRFNIPCMELDNKYDIELLEAQVKRILKKWRLRT